jgi:hypothetical protein
VIANQLVANAVILQTVADQTKVIQQLKREGYPFDVNDAKHLSPFVQALAGTRWSDSASARGAGSRELW